MRTLRKSLRQPHYFSQAASLCLPEGEMSETAVSALFPASLSPPPPNSISLLFNFTNSSLLLAPRLLTAPEGWGGGLLWAAEGWGSEAAARWGGGVQLLPLLREVKVNVPMASESETERAL